MHLTIKDLTQEALAGIGWLLTEKHESQPDSDEGFSYRDVVGDLQLDAPLSSGLLECYPRKLCLDRMERHHKTREILVALEGEAAICLAPPQGKTSGSLDGVVALRMSAGQSIILEVGAWHWIPFPTTNQAARFQVIFRSATGKDDLDFFHFSQSLDIEESIKKNSEKEWSR